MMGNDLQARVLRLSQKQGSVYAYLRKAAEDGIQAPSNGVMARALGFPSPEAVGIACAELIKKGLIRSDYSHSTRSRVVTIVGTGLATAGHGGPRPSVVAVEVVEEPIKTGVRVSCIMCGTLEELHRSLGCRTWRPSAV